MQRGRHKRMKSRCVWAVEENEEGKRKQMARERNSEREITKLRNVEMFRESFQKPPPS